MACSACFGDDQAKTSDEFLVTLTRAKNRALVTYCLRRDPKLKIDSLLPSATDLRDQDRSCRPTYRYSGSRVAGSSTSI
jgi:hypothetical protein